MEYSKKKLLFVIPSLDAGGGEKSLVNLLNSLDFNKFQVDLVLFKPSGIFMKLIPKEVHLVSLSQNYQAFSKPIATSMLSFLKKGNIGLIWSRLNYTITNFINKNKGIAEQKTWDYLKSSIGQLDKEYDVAIGFLEKSSIYFVVDCVSATRKIGFIHNDYDQLDLDSDFDLPYFKKLSTIATVSEECADVLKKNFPSEQDKIRVIYNIVSSQLIHKLAAAPCEIDTKDMVLLSIGRLHPQKGFDIALEAALILKNKNITFRWYVIGEGAERKSLESNIEAKGLQDCFILLGLKENPYPYIKAATICVQTSRYEGKSIAIDEAKILHKPIVVTNFTTAKDQISNNETGLIVAMNPESIVEGILKFTEDTAFRNKVISNLKAQNFGTESEIQKIEQLFQN